MTWLELYKFLHSKANDVSNLDSKIWDQHVTVHNGETGDEYGCDIIIFEDDPQKRHVLAFNNN